jgi:hypothetical protein
MTRARIVALAIGIITMVPSLALAQAKKGDKEVLIFGNVNTIIGGGTNVSGTVFLNVGTFISDHTEVGGGPQLSLSAGGGGGVSATVGANGFLRRYLTRKNPKIAPYYGAEASIQDFGNFGNSFFMAGIGGLKDYITEKAALDIKGLVGLNPIHPGSFVLIQVNVGLTIVW